MEYNETKMVKKALKEAGYSARVRHGKGTASGWLHIYVRNFDHEKAIKITNLVRNITGRHGDYDGRINVFGIY